MLRELKIDLEYQPTIPGPPPEQGNIYQKACAGDKVTVDNWRDIWIKNYKAASDHFGDFGERSYGKLHGINRHRPAIVIGSGPSLATSMTALKENSERDNPVLTISALHNFGLFEDEHFHADYYLSLDSGGVVIDDVSESRNKDGGFYWEATRGKKLIAYTASDPKLWELWQGEIYLFNCLIPDLGIRNKFKEIQRFTHYVSSGGNAGGASMYTAKAVMGSNPIIFVGFDMCFDYDLTFHSYSTHYDKVGEYVRWPDVYGNMRKTWPSYLNFKFWLDHIACTVPGDYVNCSEGLLGAYRDGNIAQFTYSSLKTALTPYVSADLLYLQDRQNPGQSTPLILKDLFSNPQYEHDLTFF